jgi:hypothetical protein
MYTGYRTEEAISCLFKYSTAASRPVSDHCDWISAAYVCILFDV